MCPAFPIMIHVIWDYEQSKNKIRQSESPDSKET